MKKRTGPWPIRHLARARIPQPSHRLPSSTLSASTGIGQHHQQVAQVRPCVPRFGNSQQHHMEWYQSAPLVTCVGPCSAPAWPLAPLGSPSACLAPRPPGIAERLVGPSPPWDRRAPGRPLAPLGSPSACSAPARLFPQPVAQHAWLVFSPQPSTLTHNKSAPGT
jgi:hypothetical protein